MKRGPEQELAERYRERAAKSGRGIGLRSLEIVEIAESRVSTNTGKASKNDPFLMAAIARAHAEVTEMEQTLRLTFDDLMGHAERGEAIPMDKRTLYAYNSASVVRRMADLVDDMVKLLGGRAIYNHSPIIQPWLDLHAGRAHVASPIQFCARGASPIALSTILATPTGLRIQPQSTPAVVIGRICGR